MDVLIPAIIGGFIITTALITYLIIKKPKFSDTMIFYIIYAVYYMGLVLYYTRLFILIVIIIFLILIPIVIRKFIRNI